jgi:zinc metalloprotease ZmpB
VLFKPFEEAAMKYRSLFRASLIVLVLLSVISSTALAAKRELGTSTGTGRVFLPNPVAELQEQSLTDQKDADYAALQPAYHIVTLTNLDGSGYLQGDWANIHNETGSGAFSEDNTFVYARDDERFEQVMAYYWVTEAQKYIQSLGFGSTRRSINMESQDIRINQYGVDNSYSWDKHDLLRFGKGGVDDAEDAEVILHEYGHAMQDSQVTPFGFGTSVEAGSIGEGFADYWAVTVSDVIAPTADPACVADWDSVSYTSTVPHCLRRVDRNLHYPEDLNGRVHHDGQIWSRALWDIRNALGHEKADTIILEAQFQFAPDISMPAAAQATVNAAQSLYGPSAANKVLAAFQARRILP